MRPGAGVIPGGAVAAVPCAAAPLMPDPILSANVYCSGRLCEVIHRVAGPLLREARQRLPGEEVRVWVLRYAKGGDHLKIRVHGPEAAEPSLRDLLFALQAGYFAGLSAAGPGAPRRSRALAAPIDREDCEASDHPDRTFLWTGYRRSHVSLGYRPYLGDDVYVDLLTRCLSRSTELALHRLTPSPEGEYPHRGRQNALLKGVIAGMSALGLVAEERTLYLLYHRDCLLRHVRKQMLLDRKAGSPEGLTDKLLERFWKEIERTRAGFEPLGETANRLWTAGVSWIWEEDLAAWREALGELAGYVAPICRDLAHRIDPFAADPIFPPLFKAFHGMANQLGLTPLDEAFSYHLLLALTADGEAARQPVQMRPDLSRAGLGLEPSA
jgi:hypothetical protein